MKKILMLLLVATLGIARAQSITGTASHVYDGDTFRLIQQNGVYLRVRLANIDAPEVNPKQVFGKQAKRFLSDLIDRKVVEIKIQATDRYGRKVALIYRNGQELNRLLVAKGLAWNYPEYSRDTALIRVESEARAQRIGLWQADNASPPWVFRDANRGK